MYVCMYVYAVHCCSTAAFSYEISSLGCTNVRLKGIGIQCVYVDLYIAICTSVQSESAIYVPFV